MQSLVTPQMAVGSLIKARPMAVGLMEKRKVPFWDSLHRPVSEVVRRDAIGDFMDEMAYARVPAPDTDWMAVPMYWLADYLTESHRNFLLQDVNEIGHLLDIHTIADSEESDGLRDIHKAFQAFTKALQTHVDEEESILFPKILRYEACLRDNRVHPEFHRGSIQSYMAIRLDQEEKRLCQACDLLTGKIRRHAETHSGSFTAGELLAMLGRMREKLDDHGDLEAKVLFPTAREMEKSLYNMSINGVLTGMGGS